MSFASNLEKLVAYIEVEGFTWQQVRNATQMQWRNHAALAGFTKDELKLFGRSQNVLRTALIKQQKRKILIREGNLLMAHIRLLKTDEEFFPLMEEMLQSR